ncbi:carbonic anhydrase 1-like [Amphiura filiformis]|uniref:carbonic anhydrase 1-like n=1 Tax=Amphiura filiformis TaxID=82378 RepID=UPI003B2206A9
MEIRDFFKAIFWNLIVAVLGCFAQWNYYGKVGPSKWAELWPYCCAGNKQSPIDINPSTAEHLNVSDLTFHGFSSGDLPSPSALDFINNGHTVELKLLGNFYIRGGPLDATYQTSKVNFHWGETDELGSEHSVLGRKYPGEWNITRIDR